MKNRCPILAVVTLTFLSTLNYQLSTCFAVTTINPTNKFAYGANIGWMDWRGDTNSGAAIGEYVCSGYLYAANVGWINLGNGTPTNGIQYRNVSANDFGYYLQKTLGLNPPVWMDSGLGLISPD